MTFAKKSEFFRVIHAKYSTVDCLLVGNPFWSLCIALLQFFQGPEAHDKKGFMKTLPIFLMCGAHRHD